MLTWVPEGEKSAAALSIAALIGNGDWVAENTIARLRLITTADAQTMLTWRMSDRAGFLHRGAQNLQDQMNWISTRNRNEANFIVECLCGEQVGTISLIKVDLGSASGEPARFLIDRKFSRGGFAVAAIEILYRLAFGVLELTRLDGTIAETNMRMVRWQEHFGMEIVGASDFFEDLPAGESRMVFVSLTKSRYADVASKIINAHLEMQAALMERWDCACSSLE